MRGVQRRRVGADVRRVVEGVVVLLVLVRAVVAEGVAVSGRVAGVPGTGGEGILLTEGAPRRQAPGGRQTVEVELFFSIVSLSLYIHQMLGKEFLEEPQ